MALVEQITQHWWLAPPVLGWFLPTAGRRWLAFLRDLRAYRAGN